jgi:hypothetical protein
MKVVYAKSTTSVMGEHGMVTRLTKGEPWDGDDPIVKQHPTFFADNPVLVKTSRKGWEVVEQATAAPGEKRRRS